MNILYTLCRQKGKKNTKIKKNNKNSLYSVVCVSVIINIAGVLIVPVYVRGGGLRGRVCVCI